MSINSQATATALRVTGSPPTDRTGEDTVKSLLGVSGGSKTQERLY